MEEKNSIHELEQQISKLNIGGQTGVLFDLEQLKHASVRQHVECPARLQSIFQHLSNEMLLQSPLIEVVSKQVPTTREIVGYAHDEKYLQFIDEMWPVETKKKEIYLLDTYINKHSSEAAYLGTGAVIQAIDKVHQGHWKNAFCIIRPPGHHSGDTDACTGFCFFNNVAIGAKYVQKHYNVKKVLIFDWDIHHGDGTQRIFNNDPSVLFLSIHRHDDGSFYPQSGAVTNFGEGPGAGYSINIPWDVGYKSNTVAPGTDEYIYAFERIAFPIIQAFQPEFLLVSSGFDSAEGDPLGQCKLSYEGYSYLTRRLMDLMKGKNMVVCLEGGYNLESISWASEAVLRTLTGEKIPLEKSKSQLDMKSMKDNAQPNVIGFNAVRQCLKYYRQFWPTLEEFGNEYDHKMIRNVVNESQISAGHEGNFILKNKTLLKHCKQNELQFYKQLILKDQKHSKENILIQQFTPQFLGFEIINGKEYVQLENLTYGREKASIVDFKLGKSTIHYSYGEEKGKLIEKKDKVTTSSTLGYRLSGAFIKDDIGIPTEVVKKGSYLNSLKKKDLKEYMVKLFSSNQNEINPVALQDFIKFVENLLFFFEQQNSRSFISTSIIAIVDNLSKSYSFKLIDFNYVEDLPEGVKHDENVIFGIKNLLEMSKKIQSEYENSKKK